MGEAPGAKRDHDRHGLNVSFGEAVGGPLTADSGSAFDASKRSTAELRSGVRLFSRDPRGGLNRQ
jgi:hypothetical protein